jgi:hypothetical protein
VASAESREAVLGDPQAVRLTAIWEVLAEQVQTRRDGLVSQTTWLLNLGEDGPRFAMLLDFFPASAGKRGSVFTPGDQFWGELVFYPGRAPLRALLLNRAAIEAPAPDWPVPAAALAETLSAPLLAEPWTIEVPVLLPGGRVAVDGTGRAWWRAAEGDTVLPVAGSADGLIRGTDLTRAVAIWSGGRLEILAAQTPWGRIGANG